MLSATKAFSQNRLFVINVCLLSVFFEHFYFVWEKSSDLRVGLRVKLLPMAVKVSLCALYKVNQFQKNWRRSKSTPLLRIFTYHCAFKNFSHSSGSLFLFGVFADEGTRILFELPCRTFSCIRLGSVGILHESESVECTNNISATAPFVQNPQNSLNSFAKTRLCCHLKGKDFLLPYQMTHIIFSVFFETK